MARGAISEQARLAELYQTYGDQELLKLQAQGDALTDDAAAALAAELCARRLHPPKDEQYEGSVVGATTAWIPEPATEAETETETKTEDGLVTLLALSDGLELARTCKVLEAGEIAFVIQTGAAGPERFLLRVSPHDRQAAEQILRDQMQLFPLPEVQGDDQEPDDQESDELDLVPLGDFETREEAEQVRGMLSGAGIWSSLRTPAESEMEGGWYEVEVKPGDLGRSLEVTAAGLGLE